MTMSCVSMGEATEADVQPIAFIDHPDFETVAPEDILQLASGQRLYADRDDAPSNSDWSNGSADGSGLPVLSADGERFLFRKMNYLKSEAERERRQMGNEGWVQTEISIEMDDRLADVDAVRNHIAECNVRLVMSIARKFVSNYVPFEELLSESHLILLKAIDKFDCSRGFRFSTYATHSVQRHLSRYLQQRQRRLQRENVTSVDHVAEVCADERTDEERIIDHVTTQRPGLLETILEKLDDRERHIIRNRFGFGGGAMSTLRDVAAEVGLSKERVRQIQLTAVTKLRQLFFEMCPELGAAE